MGDSITEGMLNNSYLNSSEISEYGGYRGELFQYLAQIAQQPTQPDWLKITELKIADKDKTRRQLYVEGQNGISYHLSTFQRENSQLQETELWQLPCDDPNYLICQNPRDYASHDGLSGATSGQVLSTLKASNWPSFASNDSRVLTTILLGTNDLLQKKNDDNTVANIESIIDTTIAKLEPKVTHFAFVISTVPNAETYGNLDKPMDIKPLNDKIEALVNKLKAKDWGALTGKIAFFKADQHFIKTPKNDPDVRHPNQEGWGSVHPSYYQYKVMAANLLLNNKFAASDITPETKGTKLPLTYPRDTSFPLAKDANGNVIYPANPQGFIGALKFLTEDANQGF
ncbi:MAG: hypothetical protein GY710_10080 [Desulfobacteraceae bacterium]|nr:hypothetical protein [Desulfobacteraceae bacterium]